MRKAGCELSTEAVRLPKPVSAFKDEAGYKILYDDGSVAEAPEQTIRHLKRLAGHWGMTLDRLGDSWRFNPRKPYKLVPTPTEPLVRQYLGDRVTASFDGRHIEIVSLKDSMQRVVLDGAAAAEFLEFIDRVMKSFRPAINPAQSPALKEPPCQA